MRDALQVGSFVRLEGRGDAEFVVLGCTEHTARVRRWPLADAPPAEEVLRTQISKEDCAAGCRTGHAGSVRSLEVHE